MQPDAVGDYYQQTTPVFPLRQLWVPLRPYPWWDVNWDGRHNNDADRDAQRRLRKTGVTRHILLVRHGQYDETHKVRKRTEKTGRGRI